MLILHGGYASGRLWLWAERPADDDDIIVSASDDTSPLPFDGGPQLIRQAIAKAEIKLTIAANSFQPIVAWLPTVEGIAQPSSTLIGPREQEGGTIMPWLVSAAALSPRQALPLLSRCAHDRTLTHGIVIGPSLHYLSTALRYAGALIARQRYVPSLERVTPKETGQGHRGSQEIQYRAKWQPLCTGTDAESFAYLVKSMPPSVRCLSLTNEEGPPTQPEHEVANGILSSLLDHVVRTSFPPPKRPYEGFSNVHDQWLHELQTRDGVIEDSEEELENLDRQISQWLRPLTLHTDDPFRLVFRLEELHEGRWYVRFLLQARDDPSLLVPAEEAWKPFGNIAELFAQRSFAPHEFLLAALGQAATACSRIEASLEELEPAGYEVDLSAAYDFLTVDAPTLEELGFGLMLPAWWTGRGTRTRLALRARVKSSGEMQAESQISLDDLVRFEWEVALGDTPISRDELEALAAQKSPLVKIRGQWVEVKANEIQAALEYWQKKSGNEASIRDVIEMALRGGSEQDNLLFDGVSATGWVQELLNQLEGEGEIGDIEVTKGFHGTLRPYQERGLSWLAFLRRWGLGACLADDMGLGKTIEALALVERERERGAKSPVLLVCPTSVVSNWRKEAQRFTPELIVSIHHGVERLKGRAFKKAIKEVSMVITSYSILQRDRELLTDVNWSGVILDEAQNIKNPSTKQSRAARALSADYRIVLTGTPVENNIGDLWSLMEFLNPGLLGTPSEFKHSFFIPIQACHDKSAAQRLRRITRPFILRRLKTDKDVISDLPEKQEMKVYCSLTKEQASLYKAVVDETSQALVATAKAAGTGAAANRRGVILSSLSRLKQVCNHPAHFLGDNSQIPHRSGKVERLREMLEVILQVGDAALVFTQFKVMGDLLQSYLQDTFGQEVLFLHGGVTRKNRDKLVESFQSENGPQIFILSLRAGGTGLNLTRANHVFHFDRWWNPAVESQATDRAFRIGQSKNVQVHKFICSGTLEDKIDDIIEKKVALADEVVAAGEQWLTSLSNDELKEILALREEAISDG